jgi:2-methylcitrate dehydratase PrpD
MKSTLAPDSAIEKVVAHVTNLSYDNLPLSAINAAKTFILDSIGVGISGSRMPLVENVKKAMLAWGEGHQAQVWATGEWLPAVSAAAINGYQIHNQEWDCVHEEAVVHPMAVILSSLMAYAQAHKFTGKQVILGVVVAVDIATLIGQSATSGLKFFRPSVCGCLGAVAGICAMQNANASIVKNALGIAYSQVSGTMQAHVEGSPMLALQISMNAQAAIKALDLANAGIKGPHDILEGPFGYFKLFEDTYDITPLLQKIGREFQVEHISHKPFPTGRATHGTIDGLLSLQEKYKFTYDQVVAIDVQVTPLIYRLVARPVKAVMEASYAKLCNGYVAASALITGTVNVNDFDKAPLSNPQRLALGAKVSTSLNDCTDPNALAPVTVSVTLKSGQRYTQELPAILGHPLRPFSLASQHQKFTEACESANGIFTTQHIQDLINRIDRFEQIDNIDIFINDLVSTK